MVIDALQKKELRPTLAWCAENKSRLKKSKSALEVQLRLQEFIELVRTENNMRAIAYARRLYGMTPEPLLYIFLQAGLSALKTQFYNEDTCSKSDPLSQESFRKLAKPLPYSTQCHSKLVCYITKEFMDTGNPSLVLPNGYVYSTKALKEMAKKNDDKITCPRSGHVCNYSDLVKVCIS